MESAANQQPASTVDGGDDWKENRLAQIICSNDDSIRNRIREYLEFDLLDIAVRRSRCHRTALGPWGQFWGLERQPT